MNAHTHTHHTVHKDYLVIGYLSSEVNEETSDPYSTKKDDICRAVNDEISVTVQRMTFDQTSIFEIGETERDVQLVIFSPSSKSDLDLHIRSIDRWIFLQGHFRTNRDDEEGVVQLVHIRWAFISPKLDYNASLEKIEKHEGEDDDKGVRVYQK